MNLLGLLYVVLVGITVGSLASALADEKAGVRATPLVLAAVVGGIAGGILGHGGPSIGGIHLLWAPAGALIAAAALFVSPRRPFDHQS